MDPRLDLAQSADPHSDGTCRRTGVSPAYVSKATARATGERSARPQRCHQTPVLAPYREALAALLAEENDLTLAEICGWLELHHGVVVGQPCLCRSLRRFGLTLKKSRSMRPSRTARMSRRPGTLGGNGNQAPMPGG